MEQDKKDHLDGHVYDGIIENDHPLPAWWTWTFLLTIVFAFIYFIHYEIAMGPTLQDELKIALKEIEKLSHNQPQVQETEESLVKLMGRPEMQALGAAQFSSKCSACHGQELQGSIGPNLTDHYWIHGKGTALDIVKVIREGVADKGMPPWGNLLKKDEVVALAAFIISKKDSNPANAKAPQGESVD